MGAAGVKGPRAELESFRAGKAVFVENGRVLLRAGGRDARDYLHRMTSQDLSTLGPGDVTRTLVLTPRGRIVGAPWVWVGSDAFLLDLEAETADPVRTRLERTVITEDVAFEATAATRVVVAGPSGARPLPPGEGAGGRPEISPAAWEAFRVLERVPAWGREITGEILPQEARLEHEAISFSKGCYPGQEPVVMAKHRGRPPSLLVRLRVGEGAPGAVLLRDGRRVGHLTTVTDVARDDEPDALGFVRYTLAGEAPLLEVEGGGTARVLEGEGP